MASTHSKPIQFGNFPWNAPDGNREEDLEKRKLKEENFTLRKKLESIALDKAALIEASRRFRAERNEFEYKIRKEKAKIFSALRKEQMTLIKEHQDELESMAKSMSVQNSELVCVRAQLNETMEMLNELLINPIINSASGAPNQNDNLENQITTSFESPLKNCSSIANCARIIVERQQRGRKILEPRLPKKFKCEKCPLRFFHLASLKSHARLDHRTPQALHTKVTGCRACGILFKKREDHGMHVIMVHVNDCKVDTRILVGVGNTQIMKKVEVDDNVEIDIVN